MRRLWHSSAGRLALTFGSNVLNLGTATLTSILTARALGPAGRGELAAIILWATVIAGLGGFGLTEAIVFYSGARPEAMPRIAANTLVFTVLLSLLLIPPAWAILPHVLRSYPPQVMGSARLFLLFIPGNFLGLFQIAMLQGRLHMRAFNLLRLSVSAFYLVGLLVLYAAGALTSRSAAFAVLGASTLTALVASGRILRAGWFSAWPDVALMRNMFTYGIRVHFGNMSGVLNTRLDQMLISIFLTPAQLGFYAVATTVAGLVGMVSSAFAMVAFPSMLERSEDTARRAALGRFFRTNLFFVALVTFGLIVVTPWVLRLAFGAAFSAAVPIARILLVGSMLTGCVLVVSAGFNAFNRPLTVTAGQAAGLFTSAAALWFLLPRLQLQGAAVAVVLGAAVNLMAMLIFARRQLRISTRDLMRVNAADLRAFALLSRRPAARPTHIEEVPVQ